MGVGRAGGRGEELPTGVRRRGDRFTAHAYDPDSPGGSKHLGTFASPEEAVAARELHVRSVERRRQGFRDWTCDEFAARWCVDDYLRPSATSNEYYRDAIRPFARDFAGVLMRDVTWDLGRLWVHGGVARPDLGPIVSRWKDAARVAGGWEVRAHPSNLKAVKAMFRDALKSNLIDATPFATITVRRSKGRKNIPPPSPMEVQEMVRAARRLFPRLPEIAAWIQLAAYSGLRLGELAGLRWEDINFEAGKIRVERQYRASAQQPEDRWSAPKNGNTREIVLTPPAADALLDLPRNIDGYVFHTERGRLLSQRTNFFYWAQVRAAMAERYPHLAGLEFHMLRHFYGTYLGDKGLTGRDIAHQLGHTDGGRLADELYIHTIPENSNSRVQTAFGM